jgi:hypothetical protein
MHEPMNEWGFGGEIKSWWDREIDAHPEWDLSGCTIERQTEFSRERADLTLHDSSHRAVLVIELRLPDHSRPSPYDLENLQNASDKATRDGARWSATSDGAIFVLADNQVAGNLLTRIKPGVALSRAATRSDLDIPAIRAQIRSSWVTLLGQIAPVVTGQTQISMAAPDEFFVESLRALLSRPVAAIRDAISERKERDGEFRGELIRWIVDGQGWTHSNDQFEEEIAQVASMSAYVFTTRLLFYEALRRAQPGLTGIDFPPSGSPASARALIRGLFEDARNVSHDYVTVFQFDKICEYVLLSQDAVLGWGRVLEHLGHFELGNIGYDLLGKLFERLIDPQERYYWGQHYTAPDVVDLMLSMAMPDGTGAILDPAAGGGTFLVRGYVRKRAKWPDSTHQERLRELAGCDQSAFAASIATVSLATRDLSFNDNYPIVSSGSFFQRFPGQPFAELPDLATNAGTLRAVTLPALRAVVCNPPYVGFGNIGSERRRQADTALLRAPASVPRPPLRYRYNYHLYFWFHAFTFLDQTGRLVFITSGEWLDSDYGSQLQQWLGQNMHIEFVLESLAEAWFTEARVGTCVLSGRRLSPGETIDGLSTRFVTLRKPLRVLYGCSAGESETDHVDHVDAFLSQLARLPSGHHETDDLDWSVVNQRELLNLGKR